MKTTLRLWQLGAPLIAGASLLAACGGDTGADTTQASAAPASMRVPAAADAAKAPATREDTLAWFKGAKFVAYAKGG